MTDDIRILLVEDDPSDLELTLHSLKKENLGNQIDVARDGEEALEMIFGGGEKVGMVPNNLPRLVLLDLKLPKVDGLEVLRRIKADPATRAVPIVIMTSSKEESDLVNSYKLGVNSYIQKPVDFDEFRKTVRQLGMYWLLINQPPPEKAFVARES